MKRLFAFRLVFGQACPAALQPPALQTPSPGHKDFIMISEAHKVRTGQKADGEA